MNCNGFAGLAKDLSTHNQTIIYDQRGTGQSQIPNIDSSTITMDLMIDDIETLRKHLGIEKWIVMGHSFGGMLASYYASLHPERIDGLILSSSGGIDLDLTTYVQQTINARLSEDEQKQANYWSQQMSNGDTSHAVRLKRGMALAPAYLVNKKYIPVIAERLTQGNSLINQLVWNNLRKINFDCAPQLRSFTKPVLIIQGKQDIIKEETAQKAKAVFPNAKLVIINNCSHYGWLDAPDVYMTAVKSFLVALDTIH